MGFLCAQNGIAAHESNLLYRRQNDDAFRFVQNAERDPAGPVEQFFDDITRFLHSGLFSILIRGLGSRGKRSTSGVEDILEMSNGLRDVEVLAERMVLGEIERRRSDGQSIHGLINFLKDEFRFEDDPYSVAYVFRGVPARTDYEDLMELKEVRNSLVHDGGTPQNSFFQTRPNVPNRDGRITITDEYYLKTLLTLRSVAHRIAESVAQGRYQAS